MATSNQIAYIGMRENRRHNQAAEQLSAWGNAIKEGELAESRRSNLAREKEAFRHNLRMDSETRRSNLVRENSDFFNILENQRHNLAVEGETVRSNKAREFETNRSNVARESETNRHNLSDEDIGYSNLYEARRHNVVSEREVERSHRASEAIGRSQAAASAQQAAASAQQAAAAWANANTNASVGASTIAYNNARATQVGEQTWGLGLDNQVKYANPQTQAAIGYNKAKSEGNPWATAGYGFMYGLSGALDSFSRSAANATTKALIR